MSQKTILVPSDLVNINRLYSEGKGISKICQELSLSRYYVILAYRELKLSPVSKGGGKKIQLPPNEKRCKRCQLTKDISDFRKIKHKHLIHFQPYCQLCEREMKKEYQSAISLEKRKQYRNNRKEKERRYQRERMKNDPAFKLRKLISHSIRMSLKKSKSSKTNSMIMYLDYSIAELKEHLESQFEPWMNWGNHGVYFSAQWDDLDSQTWTWQIDHIVPQSDLPYFHMTDVNFKKCWALNNLRPLLSKQNILDGTLRSRHKNQSIQA